MEDINKYCEKQCPNCKNKDNCDANIVIVQQDKEKSIRCTNYERKDKSHYKPHGYYEIF